MKRELLKLYEQHYKAIIAVRNQYLDLNFSGPLLISPRDSFKEQPNSLLVVGQETKGWKDYIDDLEKQMEVYDEFIYETKYNSPFWNVVRKLEKKLGNDAFTAGYTNISKFDVNGKSSTGEVAKSISTLDNILKEEINILNPKISIFFTGPNFDWRIKNIFDGVEFLPVDGVNPRQLSQLRHKDLPKLTFRSYHPNYLRRKKMEDGFLEFISNCVK